MGSKRHAGTILTIVLIFSFMLAPSASAFSLFNRDVSKAKKFIKAGMYPQAMAVLEKRINEEADDAEAHFLLGRCYIRTGNLSGADERFASAVRLKPDYGYQIGGESKRQVAKECFSAGKSCLDRWESNAADRCFGMAQQCDSGLAAQIKELTTAYGHKLLKVAKGKPKSQRKQYIQEARKYLSKKEIEAVFPPPSWKTVFAKQYVGVGFTGGDDKEANDGTVCTAKFGKDIRIGDKIVVKTYGNNVQVWDGPGWQKYKYPIINEAGTKGYFCVRAPKGVKFKVIIKRFQ